MDAPILDFFNEPGIIGKQKYIIEDKIAILKNYKINTALFVFTKELEETINDKNLLEEFYVFSNASSTYKCYLYNKKFIIAISPVGASAAGVMMEALGFMGITNFFACGSCGRISEEIDPTKFILVEKTIRGEGTSYHYQEPSIYCETSKELTNFMGNFLDRNKFSYSKAITWTTDSFFRETKAEIDLRKSQGAVGVEMEGSAWCAIAKFRNYNFAQLLYFSDTVQQSEWKLHATIKETRMAIINLMVNCVENFVNLSETAQP